jgi:subtilisin
MSNRARYPWIRAVAGTAAVLLLAGCAESPGLLAPDGHDAFAGATGTVEVIVVLSQGLAPGGRQANRDRAAAVAQGLGVEPSHTYGAALFGFSATVPAGRLEALRRDPRIAYVDRDLPVSLPPAPPGGGLAGPGADLGATAAAVTAQGGQVTPWGVTRIGAAEAGATGRGISVYILDTGIDPEHPDLKANLGEGFNALSCKGNPRNCPGWADDHGHGTHVAGTVGALDNGVGVVGVAPEVTLHAVKVLGSNGGGSWSDIIAGIDWVAGHNADRVRIANMSLSGFGGKSGACTDAGLVGSTMAPYQAICNARNAGVVFVVAAGNGSSDAAYSIPAAFHDAVITVSATACANIVTDGTAQTCAPGTATFPSFSNWGVGSDPHWPSLGTLPVAIAAPGASILSTTRGGGTGYMNGTSMAAPHVAGAAALLLAAHPQPANGTAFVGLRALLMDGGECTATWYNFTGHPHGERFLNARGSGYRECEAPGLAPPLDLGAVTLSASGVQLSWTYEGAGDVHFQVRRATPSSVVLLTTEAGALSFEDSGLNPATTYTYYVRAVLGDQVSIWSNRADATTLAVGQDPTPVAAFSVSCGNSDVCTFADESTGAISYRYWDFGQGNTWEGREAVTLRVVYPGAGTFHASLRVVADGWGEDTAGATITCSPQGKKIRCAPSS